MRFRPLLRREDCSSGTQYYTCASNGFSGCCSVDACNYTDGCPDSSGSESASAASSTSTLTGTITATATATATATVTATPSTTAVTATETTSVFPGVVAPSATSSAIGITSSIANTASTTSTASTASTASKTGTASRTTSTSTTTTTSTPSSAGLSKGAIAGIVTAGVFAFILLAAFLIWRHCWQRPSRRQRYQHAQLATGNVETGDGPEKRADSGRSPVSVASPKTASPTDGSTASLFGEATAATGALESSLARWGLRGSRLAALRGGRMTGSLRSGGDVADLGSYLGPVAEMPGQAASSSARPAELDAHSCAVLAELESQPSSHPAALSQNSPVMSISTGGRTAAATFVSSWRSSSSSTGIAAAMLGPDAVTPELDSTPRMESTPASPVGSSTQDSPSRTLTTDRPRATLDVSYKEQTRGLHVGSWASYQP